MTGLELINLWNRQRRIAPPLYELLIRRLTIPPYSPHTLSIVGISADRLKEMIASGEICRVRGIGGSRLAELRQLARPYHRALYVDVMQMARLGVKCEDCEKPYRDFPLDVVLPNDQWMLITGRSEEEREGGILCAACIVERGSNPDFHFTVAKLVFE